MAIVTKTDYTTEGLSRLLDTLSGAVKLEALVSSYLDRAQECEDAIFPLVAARDIGTATGDRLDIIGAILNVQRNGRTDADYRPRLRAEIAVISSDGTPDDVAEVVFALLQQGTTSKDVEVIEAYPAAIYVRAVDTSGPDTSAEVVELADLIQRAAPAGVETHYIYATDEDANIFHFSETADTTETGTTYGFDFAPLAGADY